MPRSSRKRSIGADDLIDADAIEPDAGPLESAFLQHAPRGRVGDARTGVQRVVLQIGEGIVDHRVQRFGGVTLAPVRARRASSPAPAYRRLRIMMPQAPMTRLSRT